MQNAAYAPTPGDKIVRKSFHATDNTLTHGIVACIVRAAFPAIPDSRHAYEKCEEADPKEILVGLFFYSR